MIVNTQFEELLQTLDLKWNQPFEFTVNIKEKNSPSNYSPITLCGYFPQDKNDIIYNIYTDDEFELTSKLVENLCGIYTIDLSLSHNEYSLSYDDVDFLNSLENGQNIKIKINNTLIESQIKIEQKERPDYMGNPIIETFITFLDNENYYFYYGYNETNQMGGFYIKDKKNNLDQDSTIEIYDNQIIYYEIKEGDNDDIRRKIYTGEIEINTAPQEKLTEDEQSLIRLLIEQGYTYLCGTPTKELYAFKAKDISNLNVGTMILNGGGQTRGWYHPNYFGATSSTQSLGHKINTIFKPLQSNSQFLYLKLPQTNGILNKEEFDKMVRGFITIGSKA